MSYEHSSFRTVPRTGVIYVTNEAQKVGFSVTDPAWSNLGQGQPETHDLPGAPPRVKRVEIGVDDQEYAPVPGVWEETSRGALGSYDGIAWYRVLVRIPATWAEVLKGYSNNVQKAVDSKNADSMKKSFRAYRKELRQRFYFTDQDLKRALEELPRSIFS